MIIPIGFTGKYGWEPTTGEKCGTILPRAVSAGKDCNGVSIYVGRTFFQGDIVPAKVVPQLKAAYITYKGVEYETNIFEMLVNWDPYNISPEYLSWMQCSNGEVPVGAITSGNTFRGERLFIGRVPHHDGILIGKIQPSRKVCLIPYRGRELVNPYYEALVITTPDLLEIPNTS